MSVDIDLIGDKLIAACNEPATVQEEMPQTHEDMKEPETHQSSDPDEGDAPFSEAEVC